MRFNAEDSTDSSLIEGAQCGQRVRWHAEMRCGRGVQSLFLRAEPGAIENWSIPLHLDMLEN